MIIYELLEVQGRKIVIMGRRRVGGIGRAFISDLYLKFQLHLYISFPCDILFKVALNTITLPCDMDF